MTEVVKKEGISLAFEKLSITSSDQTLTQIKNDSENPPPLHSQILLAIPKIRKGKNRADVKAIAKKINKTSGTSFDEDCIAVNISQLLDKKTITNVKTPQHLDVSPPQSFCFSTTEITSEDNLPTLCILDDTEQCQQNTHFIKSLLDDMITKITICHTNEMPTIVQEFTSDDTLIRIPNDIHTPIRESHCASISTSSSDESFQKLELKIYELNKTVNSGLALLNKKIDFFSECFNKLVNSSLSSQQKKSSEENISLLKKNL